MAANPTSALWSRLGGGYRREWLAGDLVAGLTAAAVVSPKAMAFATVAGLQVKVGLYTVLVPMAIYALFGSSRVLSVSTTTTIAILVGTALSHAGTSAAADTATVCATLTLLVGAVLLLASMLRLGFVANFISAPVLIGFKAGIGVVIVIDQLPKLLGLHIHKGAFVHNLVAIAQALPQASPVTALVGVGTLALLVLLERRAPKLPAPLVAVACGIAGVALLHLDRLGLATVGAVPTGLPSMTWPRLDLAAQLWPAALGIALMSFTESVAAGRAFARSDEPALRPNRELLAIGLANVGAAMLGGMPAGGGTTQTAVNRQAGARSRLAGLVTSAVTLGVLLVLAPLIGHLPEATIAAVVIVYSIVLIKPREFKAILSVRRTEFLWALVAVAGVVLLGTLQGILVAVVVSLAALAHQLSDPPVYVLGRKPGTNIFRPLSDRHSDDECFPGLLLLRLHGRLFFANAERIGQKILALMPQIRPRVVAFDLSGVYDLEYTALKMLSEAEQRHREAGVTLWLVGMNPEVLRMVRRSPLGGVMGQERMFFNLEEAVARYGASQSAGPVEAAAARA
jgi:high affinity sulfate transporter 1